MIKRWIFKGLPVALMCLLFFVGGVRAQGHLHVAVSIPPQAYFVEQIGGRRVSVLVLLPPGANPATYEPKARDLVSLSEAELFFRIHVPFEDAWMEKFRAVNTKMKVIDTTKGLKGLIKGDPHIWLSPTLVKQQAAMIASALIYLDPEGESEYRGNLKRFQARVDRLAETIRRRFRHLKRRRFLVYHPCWGYFAREFGLEQMAIEREGKAPGAAYLAKIISLARKEGIRCIFAQPQFDTRSARIIARQIHGHLVLADPMAEKWDVNLLEVSKKIEACLGR